MKPLTVTLAGAGAALALIWLATPAAQGQGRAQAARPPVTIPADNPQTAAKVALGAKLYFDPRLSADGTVSCATCHDPATAWANHGARDTGIHKQVGGRNSGTILDSAYMKYQFWDGRAATLEEQALGPIQNPIEMGETLDHVVAKLNSLAAYRAEFRQVFGTDVTSDGIAKAIAAFERTVVTGPSPYDRYLAGDSTALSPAATRGLQVFRGKALCAACHSGAMLSDQSFHNLGVGMAGAKPDSGREAVTHDPKDRGKFKTPSLRNVALTWPYLHDGSARSLDDVIALYAKGGVANPNLDPKMMPLRLTPGEREDLRVFLESLTGTLPAIAKPALPTGQR
jgi:cytochrome c peroxidase